MVRTRSGPGNDNKSLQPEPRAVEHVPKVVPVVEGVTMEMLRALLVEQRDEMRQLLWENGREPTVPAEQPELNGGQS